MLAHPCVYTSYLNHCHSSTPTVSQLQPQVIQHPSQCFCEAFTSCVLHDCEASKRLIDGGILVVVCMNIQDYYGGQLLL